MLQHLAMVALGGAIGSSLRFLVNTGVLRLVGGGFPWATLFVNAVGSFAMGVLVELLARRGGQALAPFLMTGILGGFTTFSAFSLDAVTLWTRGQTMPATAYVGGSLILSVGGLILGMALIRGISG